MQGRAVRSSSFILELHLSSDWAMLQPCPCTLSICIWPLGLTLDQPHYYKLVWPLLILSCPGCPHWTWSWPWFAYLILLNLGPALLLWTCLVVLCTLWTLGWPWLVSLDLLCSSGLRYCETAPLAMMLLPCYSSLVQSSLPQGSVAVIFFPA